MSATRATSAPTSVSRRKQSAGGAIDPDISAEGSGQLQKGWAWVQFCVTTDEDLDTVQMAWAPVVVNS